MAGKIQNCLNCVHLKIIGYINDMPCCNCELM